MLFRSTRLGGGAEGVAAARALTMVTAFLPGSMYIYQGDELGLQDCPVPPEARRDPIWRRSGFTNPGRDAARVPMPWDSMQTNFGFSTAAANDLWLPISPDWRPTSAAAQIRDPASTWTLYQRMLSLRRRHPGWREPCSMRARHGQWELTRGSLRLVVNTTDEPAPVLHYGTVLARSRMDVPWEPGVLPPRAAVLLETSDPESQVEGETLFGVSRSHIVDPH